MKKLSKFLTKQVQKTKKTSKNSSPDKNKPSTGMIKPISTQSGQIPNVSQGSPGSFLAEDTNFLDRKRREIEQAGHAKYAKVHAKNHQEDWRNAAPSLEAGEDQNTTMEHPDLDKPYLDGIDNNLTPSVLLTVDPETRANHENALRLQHQLHLQKQQQLSSAPTIKPSY